NPSRSHGWRERRIRIAMGRAGCAPRACRAGGPPRRPALGSAPALLLLRNALGLAPALLPLRNALGSAPALLLLRNALGLALALLLTASNTATAAPVVPWTAKLAPRLVTLLDSPDTVTVWVEFADKGESGPADLAARLAAARAALTPRAR